MPTASSKAVVPAVNQIELHPYFQRPELQRVQAAHGRAVHKSAAQVMQRRHLQEGRDPEIGQPGPDRRDFAVFDFELSAD